MRLGALPIRQVAYFVADVREAALRHSRLFGSGPFFVADNILLKRCLHRGREAAFDHSSAYGQWGEVMVELVQQNNPGPSALRDLYPDGPTGGLHHVALFVDDLAAAIAGFEAAGYETALHAELPTGFAFAMMDTVALNGHMVELYEPTPDLTGFYDYVRRKSRGFDGSDPVRTIRLG